MHHHRCAKSIYQYPCDESVSFFAIAMVRGLKYEISLEENNFIILNINIYDINNLDVLRYFTACVFDQNQRESLCVPESELISLIKISQKFIKNSPIVPSEKPLMNTLRRFRSPLYSHRIYRKKRTTSFLLFFIILIWYCWIGKSDKEEPKNLH
jgi:hypothetical protein